MKLGATDSIKFKKLKRTLKLSHWEAVGLLESIWLFTSRNAPLGDIGRHSDDDIAAAIEWSGDSQELIDALAEHRWIDRSEEHRLLVHDWPEHMPTWLVGSLARHNKKAIGREPPKEPPKEPPTQAAMERPSLSSLTNSSLTTPIPEGSVRAGAENKTPGDDMTFLEGQSKQLLAWWNEYPEHRRTGQKACERIWPHAVVAIQQQLACDEKSAFGHLMDRTRLFAKSWKGRNARLCWSAENFLEDGHYNDPLKAWEDPGEASPRATKQKLQPLPKGPV